MPPAKLKTLRAQQPFPIPVLARAVAGRALRLPPLPGPGPIPFPREAAEHGTKEPAGRLLFICCHCLPKADTGHPHKAVFTFLRPL